MEASRYCCGVATEPSALAGLAFSLVGPGKVGSSLAVWAQAAGARLVATAGRGEVGGLRTEGQDLLLVAVPDGALVEVAAALAGQPQAAVALHTAGSLDASVLAPLRAGGSAVGSLHPLKAFPHPLPDFAEARGVCFAIDGDLAAQALALRLAAAWEAVVAEVPAAARPLYHFAATLAAGGVLTLLATAAEIAARLELPPAVEHGYLELARGALATATPTGAAAALTGPVARGDTPTVLRHLAALRNLAPEKLPLAIELARETLRHLDRLHPLSPPHQSLLAALDQLAHQD